MKPTALFFRKVTTRSCLLALLLLAVSAPVAFGGFDNFITRKGDRLYEGDKEFRFLGANMPGLMLPYDFTLRLPERMGLPTPWEQEDAFKTLVQMNLRVVRTWNLPIRSPRESARPWHYVLGPGEFNEEAFRVVDQMFALANRYGVRVIFALTADAGDYLGGIETYAAHRSKTRAEFYTDPQVREDYKATLRHVLNRVNTVTGIRYRDDKAVLAWQFGNEMYRAPDAWLAEMAAYLRTLSPHQLVAESRHRPLHAMYVDANIDLVTRHLYTNYPGIEAGWAGTLRGELEELTDKRPLFVGEFGPYIDGNMFTPENLLGEVQKFLDYVVAEPGISGAMLWSMYFHKETGGFYWHQIFTYPAVWSYHWPGFPSAEAQREVGLMSAIRAAAFRIEGKAVPPLPVPDVPEMLPVGEVPLLSWRGSAGATAYDLERAPTAHGPWTLLAGNVSDADVAYRPLFSDTTARAGETWHYRVSARNSSGVSAPSKAVGPVQIAGVCLVDELQDFSRAAGRSAGLRLNNDYNGVYAEYLFRAQGVAGDWLAYEVPAEIKTVKVAAFYAGAPLDLILETSDDGTTYAPLAPARTVRQLAAPPGGPAKGQTRLLVEYEATPPAGRRHVKIRWQGPVELDRVELYHHGKP